MFRRHAVHAKHFLTLRCLNEQTALHTLIDQRHLTPSCRGRAPTAERTMGPARMFIETLSSCPELKNSQGHSGGRQHSRIRSASPQNVFKLKKLPGDNFPAITEPNRSRGRRWDHTGLASIKSGLAAVQDFDSAYRARTSRAVGTERPSARAVLRLMISSTLVVCCTGRSAGFSPLRIRPV